MGTQGAMMGGMDDMGGDIPPEGGDDDSSQPDPNIGRTGKEIGVRPKEGNKYKKDSGARGRDPLGSHDMKKGGSGAPKYGKPLALAHFDRIKKSMNLNGVEKEIISESSELEQEYEKEVKSSSND